MDLWTKIDFLEFPLAPERLVDIKLVCQRLIVIFSHWLKIFGNIGIAKSSRE
jgi:hypothetical protein